MVLYIDYGDYMKINFLIPIVSAILLGYLCANFVISEYVSTAQVAEKTVYYLQISASDTEDNINNSNIKNKIVVKEDKYYTYIGMTLDKEIANKIKDIYRNYDVDVYIKEKNINNKFISELEQYDILLKNSNTKEELDNILSSILSSYEEIINN